MIKVIDGDDDGDDDDDEWYHEYLGRLKEERYSEAKKFSIFQVQYIQKLGCWQFK